MPRESGASSNPSAIGRTDALPKSQSRGYWIARSSRATTIMGLKRRKTPRWIIRTPYALRPRLYPPTRCTILASGFRAEGLRWPRCSLACPLTSRIGGIMADVSRDIVTDARADRYAACRDQFRQYRAGPEGPRDRRAARRLGGLGARARQAARRADLLRRLRRRRQGDRCGQDRRAGHLLPRHRSRARRGNFLHRRLTW